MKTFNRTLLAMTIYPILILASAQHQSWAADIDIYGSPTNSSTNPNILVIIDNSANWSANNQHWPIGKQGESELTALRSIVGELADDVNVGLMLFTDNSPNGGYVRYHMRPMNSTNVSALRELIGTSSCAAGNNSLNGTPNCIYNNFNDPVEKVATSKVDYSATMFEAFKYFGGYTNPLHANDDPVTVATPGSPTDATHYGPYRYAAGTTTPDPKSDPAAYTGGSTKPNYGLNISSCAKNYIIFIGNGFPNSDSPASLLSGVGGDTSQVGMATYSTSSVVSTSTLGSTNLCYTSAASVPASDYPPSCATYTSPDNCSVGTAIANTAATTCPDGQASYPVLGTITAQPAVTNASHSITGTTQGAKPNQTNFTITAAGHRFGVGNTVTISGCPVGNSDAKTLNGNHVVATSTPASNIFTITDGNGNAPACTSGTVVGTDVAVASSITDLGHSQCASACSTADFANLCGSTYSSCSCSTPTVNSSPVCASGKSKYNILSNLTVTTATASTTTTIPPASGIPINYADEWARFLNLTDVSSAVGQQNVKTYTIDVYKDAQDANETALLRSMAAAGGGKYFSAQNQNAIINALRQIMSEIQSVNSVFASSSLPVNVNAQGTYLNQVFIGMFRPDSGGKPRWAGNLKQYQFGYIGNLLKLVDNDSPPKEAVSGTTGFISTCAKSFWSSDSGPYWYYPGSVVKGSCNAETSQFPITGSSSIYSDFPDGDVVEKGGAAQRLRGEGSSGDTLTSRTTNYATRALKTCNGSSTTSCTTLLDFNSTNASSLTTDLIDWIRGKDVDNENGDAYLTEMRPSALGDVVHSQPGVVDYGSPTGVVAFYGANDGALHAINANKAATDGNELWGFIAPETFSRLSRLRTNSPYVSLPGISTALTPTPTAKDYFFDGSVGVHQKNGIVWIFATMRRGGRAIYAFDVSTPASPSLKWRKGCFTNSTGDDSNCSTGWSTIGQTWSKPQVGFLSSYVDSSSNPKPVLVFGGGYDSCEDTDNQTRCASTPRKGANIWFVDADTGAIIRTYPTNYSVPGDVILVKNSSGNIDNVYAGDTGGYVYRINVGTWDGATLGSAWTSNSLASNITIANLSETGHSRKFMSGPDVVETADYNAVLIGSGDREHPLLNNYPCGNNATAPGSFVTNAFYMIKDTPTGYPATPVTTADLTSSAALNCSTINSKGWYFYMPNSCEQVINKATSIGGVTYFGTNQPVPAPAESCATNLGVARGYAVKILTGCALPGTNGVRSTILTGGGLPPSPVAGVVQVGEKVVPFCLGCAKPPCTGVNCDPPCDPLALGGCEIPINPPGTRSRTYWYKN